MASTRNSKHASRPGTDSAPIEELSFEDAMERLEAIVQRLEAGEVGLEQTIGEYEQGMRLLNRCRDVLTKSEQRVEELQRKAASSEKDSTRGTQR